MIKNSLYGYVEGRFGPDDFVFYASQTWSLNAANVSLCFGETPITGQPTMAQSRGNYVIRFSAVADVSSPLTTGASRAPSFLACNLPMRR